MATRLKYIDPTRSPGLFSRGYASLANTRLGRFISVNFMWKVDPYLMRATRGRLGMGLNPDIALDGIPMQAAVVADETERQRLWALADRVFAPYAAYRREAAKANRTIPIVQLTPRG